MDPRRYTKINELYNPWFCPLVSNNIAGVVNLHEQLHRKLSMVNMCLLHTSFLIFILS